jgi:hypothetical protein
MNQHPRALDRRGVALPLALLGLVLISLLVTAALLSSSTQFAMSNAQQEGTAGLYASDAALESYVAAAALLGTADALAPGNWNYALNGQTWTMQVARLSSSSGAHPTNPALNRVTETYSILTLPPGDRGRRVGALVNAERDYRRFSTNINSGASVSSDKIKLPGGSATLSGIDTSNCKTGNVAGLTLAAGVDASQVNASQVEGGIQQTSVTKEAFAAHLLDGMSPDEFAKLADIKWGDPARLRGARTHSTYTFDTNAFDYTRASWLNWGCPLGLVSPDPCMNDDDKTYSPVVAVRPPPGEEAQFKGVGQGVLVVLGNARFNAGFIFKGIVVVVGELTVNGGTNVYGAMVALGDVTLQDKSTADAGAEETVFNGQSLVKFDRCQLNNAIDAINKAMGQTAPQAVGGNTYAWFESVR